MTPFDELTVHPLRMARLLKAFGACFSVLVTVTTFQVLKEGTRDLPAPEILPFSGLIAVSPIIVSVIAILGTWLLRRGNWRFMACFAACTQIFWALGIYIWVVSIR